MTAPARLGGYLLVLLVVFAAAFGVGRGVDGSGNGRSGNGDGGSSHPAHHMEESR